MNKYLYVLGGIVAFVGFDRLLGAAAKFGYKEGLKEGHKRGHECMLNTMRKSPTFREAANSLTPMHTEN